MLYICRKSYLTITGVAPAAPRVGQARGVPTALGGRWGAQHPGGAASGAASGGRARTQGQHGHGASESGGAIPFHLVLGVVPPPPRLCPGEHGVGSASHTPLQMDPVSLFLTLSRLWTWRAVCSLALLPTPTLRSFCLRVGGWGWWGAGRAPPFSHSPSARRGHQARGVGDRLPSPGHLGWSLYFPGFQLKLTT